VQLVADSSGSPGTVLDSATVDGDDIPLESGWVEFDLATTDSLTYGTTYGLVVLRSGSNSHANYYEVEVDAGATYSGGALKVYDGSAWQTPSPTAELLFRVLGGVDTGAQAGDILRTVDGITAVDAASSGIVSNQYRDGETRAIDEMAALLDTGTSGGFRLIARILPGGAAVIAQRPSRPAAAPRWVLRGGRLLDLLGQPAEEGFLPAGEWVQIGDGSGLGPWARLSPVFAERAEYRAGGGLTVEPEGQADMYDMGVAQG
jgi:hypothetical protein